MRLRLKLPPRTCTHPQEAASIDGNWNRDAEGYNSRKRLAFAGACGLTLTAITRSTRKRSGSGGKNSLLNSMAENLLVDQLAVALPYWLIPITAKISVLVGRQGGRRLANLKATTGVPRGRTVGKVRCVSPLCRKEGLYATGRKNGHA